MVLTDHEKRMLDGKEGLVKQASMAFIVRYARALGAERLCRVTKAQVFCGNHLYLEALQEPDIDRAIARLHFASEEPLPFDHDTACHTQTCALRTDLDRWAELGFSAEEAAGNEAYLERYRKAGVRMVGTCAPYLTGFVPVMGEHYVCTESHAILFMNSLWGACANADGIAAAFCSAMCGRTAYWGNHVREQRAATALVHLECDTETVFDWDSLGFVLGGKLPPGAVPALALKHPETADADRLRAAFASMATSGGAELCHVIGVTPEAPDLETAFSGRKPEWETRITRKEVNEARAFLSEPGSGEVDFVHLGCPHDSLEQIARLARDLEGRSVADRVALHVWTAPSIRFLADLNGFTGVIEKAGGKLFAGSCALLSGKLPEGTRSIAFDAAKQANPLKSLFPGRVLYGSREQCLRAALSGRWEA